MKQATQIIIKLVKTHKGMKPTEDKNVFDQGIDAGLILARQALLDAKYTAQQEKWSRLSVKDVKIKEFDFDAIEQAGRELGFYTGLFGTERYNPEKIKETKNRLLKLRKKLVTEGNNENL